MSNAIIIKPNGAGVQTGSGGEIFNDYNTNKAYGAFSTAHGTNSIAGVRGFYYTRVEFTEDLTQATFYLSAYQLPNNPSAPLPWEAADRVDATEDWSNIEGYAVGSVISYVLNSKLLDQGKVIDFNKANHTMTIKADAGKTLGVYKPGTGANYDINGIQIDPGLDDQTLYSITQPEIGLVALGWHAFAVGENCKAYDRSSIALGRDNVSRGQFAYTEGRKNTAYRLSHAEGYNNQATGEYAHAEGGANKATADYTHVEGYQNEATGTHAHAEGKKTKATGNYAHVENDSNQANGNASHAEGENTRANGRAAHTEGYQTQANADFSHAEGYQSIANGNRSHAEGTGSIAEANNSHAETGGKAYGNQSHAETASITYGDNSHAEGAGSTTGAEGIVTGTNAHAEGHLTQAIANHAHAEGSETKAGYIDENNAVKGHSAHAEGYRTEARDDLSHTEGEGTIANARGQHVQGRYNEIDETATKEHPWGKYAHIVGAGSSTNRKNIHTIDWNGNGWFAGKVTVGENKDEVITTANINKYTNNSSSSSFTEIVLEDGNLYIDQYDNGLYKFRSAIGVINVQARSGSGAQYEVPYTTAYNIGLYDNDYLLVQITGERYSDSDYGIAFHDFTSHRIVGLTAHEDPDIEMWYNYYHDTTEFLASNNNVSNKTDELLYVNNRYEIDALELGTGLTIDKGILNVDIGAIECNYLVMTSPDGTKWKITIADNGEFATSVITN